MQGVLASPSSHLLLGGGRGGREGRGEAGWAHQAQLGPKMEAMRGPKWWQEGVGVGLAPAPQQQQGGWGGQAWPCGRVGERGSTLHFVEDAVVTQGGEESEWGDRGSSPEPKLRGGMGSGPKRRGGGQRNGVRPELWGQGQTRRVGGTGLDTALSPPAPQVRVGGVAPKWWG